jgi:hypothetical protein
MQDDWIQICWTSVFFQSDLGPLAPAKWVPESMITSLPTIWLWWYNIWIMLLSWTTKIWTTEIVILSQVAIFFLDAPTVWWWASLNLSDDPISVGWSVQFKEHPISWDRNLPTLSGGEQKSNSWVHNPIFWDHHFNIVLLFPNPLSKFFMFFSMRTIQVFGFSHGKKSRRPWVSVRSFISSGWQRPWSARLHRMLRSGDFHGDSFYGY